VNEQFGWPETLRCGSVVPSIVTRITFKMPLIIEWCQEELIT
jgi:hypothetical protein